ncbi:MAG: hypothetical protein J7L19_00975 [Dehalococcoidia bacterium]|nr:hypothetical protein [Dehalococcoidia bacterium]
MIKTIAISKAQAFPKGIKYTDIRSYAFTFLFVALSTATPWIFHQFHLAGPIFLPMHFFVLVAGLLFGWRAGLIVGLSTPIISFVISGMPAVVLLPQIIAEVSTYGLVAGILRERFNLRVIWSLIGAMIGGRLTLLLVLSITYLMKGATYSPLSIYTVAGGEINPLASFWSTIALSWPGIIIQLISISVIIKFLKITIAKNSRRDS